jgi:hypothetical protein
MFIFPLGDTPDIEAMLEEIKEKVARCFPKIFSILPVFYIKHEKTYLRLILARWF